MRTSAVLLSFVCLLLLAAPVSGAAAEISRSIEIPESGAPVEVTVSLPADLVAAGLVEELPGGWEYLDSSLLPERVRVVDGTVLFALVNESGDLTYRVIPPDPCTGTFHGTLRDFSEGKQIDLPDTRVENGAVVETFAGQTDGDAAPDPTAAQTPRSPGFGVMGTILACAITAASILNMHRCRRNER